MLYLYKAVVGLLVWVLLGATAARADEDWVTYSAPEYGFTMLVPAGATFVEREYWGGWAELRVEHDGVILYALTKLGEQAKASEIEAVGVRLTGIPGDYWKTVSSGQNVAGWNWYHTVEASQGGKLYVGDYGTGPRGSYLLVLQTTESDYNTYRGDYRTWYESIRLK